MARYVVQRVTGAIIVLLLMSFIVFMLINVLPGNTLQALISERGGGRLDPEVYAAWERGLGLDLPVLERYANWLSHALQWDLGNSFVTDQPVLVRLGERLPISLELILIASVVSFVLAVPIGVLSAVRRGGASDYAARTFAILGLAIPNFFLGVITLIIFSRWFNISLGTMKKPEIWEDPIQNLQGLIVPALVLASGLMAGLMRMARSSTLEVLNEDYVRTARAKGLGERIIVTRHVLRNTLIPITTLFGLQIAFVLGGTVIVEEIFSVPGFGSLLVRSVRFRDLPVVMGVALVTGFVVVATNLLVDLSYAVIDPRIRYS